MLLQVMETFSQQQMYKKKGDLSKDTYCTAEVSLYTLILSHFFVFCRER